MRIAVDLEYRDIRIPPSLDGHEGHVLECNHFDQEQHGALWAATFLDLYPLADIITPVDGN
ncbi:MAG: hypothetical protein ACYS3N_16980 [Planctomycetota bacterium]